LAAVGVSLGLALASKFSAISLLGVLAVVAAAEMLSGNPLRLPARAGAAAKNKGILARLAVAGAAMGILLGLAFLAFWSTYFFHSLAACRDGLVDLLNHQHHGQLAFLMDRYSTTGWWYYFPVALLVKTPVPTLILIAGSFVLCRAGRPLRWRGVVFLVLPVVLVLAAATTVRINIGVRHVLIVYPILYVAAARLATVRIGRAWMVPGLTGLLTALGAVSSLRVAPYELSYFNEIAGGPAGGLHYLGDSNLDWGQGLRGLKAYMDRERIPLIYLSYFGSAMPEDYAIRYQFAPGGEPMESPSREVLPRETGRELLAVSASSLQGTYFGYKDLYRWLLTRKPVATIGHAIYIYDLTGDVDAHLALAEVYNKVGLETLATPEWQKVLKIRPDNAEAHNGLGLALAGCGQLDEAIAHFQRALEIKRDYAEAHNNLGTARVGRGELDEAMAHYRKALEIKPDYAEVHVNLGVALARCGRIDEAMAHFQRALEIEPGYAEAHIDLGTALANRRRMDEAIAHFKKALEIEPDYAEAHINLGIALAGSGRTDEAMAHFQKALEIKPDYAEAHINLGIALAAGGRIDEAIDHYQKALVLATQQNKAALVEELQVRLQACEAETPHRQPRQPFPPRSTMP
jgi:tetratricopeptide (TPR) repeat protein